MVFRKSLHHDQFFSGNIIITIQKSKSLHSKVSNNIERLMLILKIIKILLHFSVSSERRFSSDLQLLVLSLISTYVVTMQFVCLRFYQLGKTAPLCLNQIYLNKSFSSTHHWVKFTSRSYSDHINSISTILYFLAKVFMRFYNYTICYFSK